jgi:hypothetical protein
MTNSWNTTHNREQTRNTDNICSVSSTAGQSRKSPRLAYLSKFEAPLQNSVKRYRFQPENLMNGQKEECKEAVDYMVGVDGMQTTSGIGTRPPKASF